MQLCMSESQPVYPTLADMLLHHRKMLGTTSISFQIIFFVIADSIASRSSSDTCRTILVHSAGICLFSVGVYTVLLLTQLSRYR